MNKFLKIGLSILFLDFICHSAQADIVLPAIAKQFAVSSVVPSYYSILLAICVLLIEAYFIKKLFEKNFLYGFGLSFFINLFSSILGIFITDILAFLTRKICMDIFGYSNMRVGTYLGMIPGYGITVLVEWFMLLAWAKLFCSDKFKPKNLFKLSLIMNFCSYLVLVLGILIADLITHGQNFQSF